MNKIQIKKNIINYVKCISITAILILVIIVGISGYFWSKKKTIPTPVVSIIPSASPLISPFSTPTPSPEIWETYTNTELGFLIKYPQMVYGVYRCSPSKPFWVPLKVFEDKENRIVYITEEYYYDNWDSKTQANTGSCEKIIYTLESLQNEWKEKDIWGDSKGNLFSLPNEKIFLGWGILISNIKKESELNKFIKDNYGPGCVVANKKTWKQKGTYEIEINGEDWDKGADLGTTTCPWNYPYKILYAPEKNKIMSVKLGQDCGFGTDYNSKSYKCYDEEMINSFEFFNNEKKMNNKKSRRYFFLLLFY